MLKKGHEFGQKKKRTKVKRKQRRKESEIDRGAVQQRRGIIRIEKEKPPRKKKKPKANKDLTDLNDANLHEIQKRYKAVDVESDRPVGELGLSVEQIEKLNAMRGEKTVKELFREVGIPLHTHGWE